MKYELYNLISNENTIIGKEGLKKIGKTGDMFILKKPVLNQIPEFFFIKNNKFKKIGLIEAEISKKYARKINGHETFDTMRENIQKNYKKIGKTYYGKDLDSNKIKNLVDKLTPVNVDKTIKNNKVLLEKLQKTTGDRSITKDNKIIQEGGITIWIFEKWLARKAETSKNFAIASVVFGSLLDLVDLALGIASAIPGLQAVYGVGFALDFIGIAMGILRFDIISTIFDVISLLPVIGDIIGGVGNSGKTILKLVTRIAGFINQARGVVGNVKGAIDTAKDVHDMATSSEEEEEDYEEEDDE